jgi:hypothetical protein
MAAADWGDRPGDEGARRQGRQQEARLTVRQVTGLSLPQEGMGIEGPKQGVKMR